MSTLAGKAYRRKVGAKRAEGTNGFETKERKRACSVIRSDMLEKSVLVVAHFDDEVLWFSSILEEVEKLVVCYLDDPSNPQVTAGRIQCLSRYPLHNVVCLRLIEAGVFNRGQWDDPAGTLYGMEIDAPEEIRHAYETNYKRLGERLRSELAGYVNVVTHNPWGEYGHEEHVQVYRAVRDLRPALGFRIWFSNYCSNRSLPLLLREVSGFKTEYFTLPTNKFLAEKMRSLYVDNSCWTWYPDYEWFNDESFMLDRPEPAPPKPYGRLFPLNLVKIEFPRETGKKSLRHRALSRVRKIFSPSPHSG